MVGAGVKTTPFSTKLCGTSNIDNFVSMTSQFGTLSYKGVVSNDHSIRNPEECSFNK